MNFDGIRFSNSRVSMLVMDESKPNGWFVVRRCTMSAIKFTMAGGSLVIHRWYINSIIVEYLSKNVLGQ